MATIRNKQAYEAACHKQLPSGGPRGSAEERRAKMAAFNDWVTKNMVDPETGRAIVKKAA